MDARRLDAELDAAFEDRGTAEAMKAVWRTWLREERAGGAAIQRRLDRATDAEAALRAVGMTPAAVRRLAPAVQPVWNDTTTEHVVDMAIEVAVGASPRPAHCGARPRPSPFARRCVTSGSRR